MKIKRLLLIPEIKWCGRFLISLSLFFRMWLTSRRLKRLAYAAPAFGLTFAFAWAVIVSHLRDRDPALLEQYLTLARQAVVDTDIQDARLLFRRAQQLAPGDKDITTELASSLFQLGERSEAYQMLSSVAPVQKSGHLSAHRFLAQNPPELPPAQKDYFRAVHLSHLVRNSAETREERVQLLHILAQYRKFDDVEKLIRDALDRYPEDRLYMAQLKFRRGDQLGARRETEEACRAFTVLVKQDAQNADRRIHLAQGYVFLGKFADAVCVLAEGMTAADSVDAQSVATDASTAGHVTVTDAVNASNADLPLAATDRTRKLALTFSNTYFAWMTTLPANEQAMQLRCLQRMLNPNADATTDMERPSELNAKMQAALLNPATSWVLSAMEGNARVVRGEWALAEKKYRVALQSAPDDPTLANNLAWVLLKKARSTPANSADDQRQQLLSEALSWSEKAVGALPEIVSFLETRGQIQAELGNHAQAISDLTACINRGKDTPEIQRTIEACARALR